MTSGITIRLGALKIENCMEKVSSYCLPIGQGGITAFELYDQVRAAEDDELSVSDIWLANGIAAGIEVKQLVGLWREKEAIEERLAPIPRQIGLESDRLPSDCFERLGELFEVWMVVDGWGAARVTKVLHKKRPLLVPPVDSQTMELYSQLRREAGVQRWRYYPSEAGDVVNVIRQIREHIRSHENLPHLRTIQETLAAQGIQLSIARIFDIILWKPTGWSDLTLPTNRSPSRKVETLRLPAEDIGSRR